METVTPSFRRHHGLISEEASKSIFPGEEMSLSRMESIGKRSDSKVSNSSRSSYLSTSSRNNSVQERTIDTYIQENERSTSTQSFSHKPNSRSNQNNSKKDDMGTKGTILEEKSPKEKTNHNFVTDFVTIKENPM